MNDSDPKIDYYEADGSPQFGWDPAAIASHSQGQRELNLRNVELAKQQLRGQDQGHLGANMAAETAVATDVVVEPVTVVSQPELPMGQEPAKPPKKPRDQVAFGRFLRTDIYDVFGDYDISDVTDPEKTWMHPKKLAEVLFAGTNHRESGLKPKPRSNAEKASADEAKPDFRVRGVPLTAYEYGIIPRSAEHIGLSAAAHVLGASSLSDEKIAASKRGQGHVIGKRADQATDHLDKLRVARDDLTELAKEARAPGFAHKSKERMSQLISVAWNEFTTILDAVHLQRGWNDEKRARAEAALISYLTVGEQRRRVGHWQEMIGLSQRYLDSRISVFNNRVNEAKRRVNQSERKPA